jgi:HEPN domain-containing protein
MDTPFELIRNTLLKVFFLFTNADGFYISARHALLYGWVGVGSSNAHQSIELYIKAILALDYKAQTGHDLVKLLKKYKTKAPYFSSILEDPGKVRFLNELSEGYILHRYGEAGSNAKPIEIIALLDELAFNLRTIYLHNVKSPSKKIYMPDKLTEEFLAGNAYFTKDDLTTSRAAQLFLPTD